MPISKKQILQKDIRINEISLSGIEDNKIKRSAISRDKYFGMSSPKNNNTVVEIISMVNSSRLKIVDRRTALIEANAMFAILFPISIVEKKFCGF